MIAPVPRRLPLYVRRERTRHGRVVFYFRRNDGERRRLPAPDDPGFAAAYAALLAGTPPAGPARRGAVGSLEWLIGQYQQASAYAALSPATRRQRDNIFKGVIAKSGGARAAAIDRADIERGREARAATPAQARNFLDAMRGLFRWAAAPEVGHVPADVTDSVRNPPRRASEGFPAWSLDDVARYEARWPKGSRERVWMHILLYVGCRRGDAVTLGRQHLRDGVLAFVTEKGRDQRRIEVARTVEPELAATLAAGPTGDLSFICGEHGRPLTKESFGNLFKVACVAAGLPDRSAHGLRKLSATIWAERGASEHELMAMFGWLTPAMAALYTRKAERRRLALNAHARLMGTGDERKTAAPGNEVRRSERKAE